MKKGKMRILQFPIANPNGGITRHVLNNWKYIDKDKFQFDFVTMSKEKLVFEDELLAQGCKVYHLSCYAEEDKEKFEKELIEIFKNGYDVVQLHTSYWKSFFVEEVAKRVGVKRIIIHSHSSGISKIKSANEIELAQKLHESCKDKLDISMATDFCACSNFAADWLFGSQIPRDKIKIIKNAINVEKFIFNKEIRDSYRKKIGLEKAFVVGNIGRFSYEKNQEFLITVFSEVANKLENAKLLLIGTGSLEEKYKELVEKLRIKDKVIFTGARNDVENLLQVMDLFCLPSRFEGLPIVMIEAQAAGLKCLGSDSITPEVCITENVEMLPLEKEIWVKEILNISKGYERASMYDEITNKGYNIELQIKELEKLYLNSTLL